jgi:stage II sporulation protein R
MKKMLFPILILCAATIFLAAMPTEAECAIYEDTVRLHILANSDSVEDQSLKLELRDAVLSEYGKHLAANENARDAENALAVILPDIEHFCNNKIKELGFDYTVRASLGTEWYDTRDYKTFSLPCGYYTSLKISIGEGDGQNWWCVMFPPLCLDAATSSAGYSDEEKELISGKYKIKFKILELISEITK